MALTKISGSVIKDSVSLSGNVSVGGTLTYQDVTNVDALGIGTFRTGIKVLAGQVDVGSNIKIGNAGVITATSFVGSGANLTGITQTTINNNADNRVITGSGSANTLEGESTLTFDTTNGLVCDSGTVRCNNGFSSDVDLILNADANNNGTGSIIFKESGDEKVRIDSSGNVNFGANKAVSLPSGTGIQVYNSSAPRIKLVNDTTGNAAGDGLQIYVTGSTAIFDHKENAEMRFYTNATERLRIDAGGGMQLGTSTATASKLTVYGANDAAAIFQGSGTGTGAGNGLLVGNNGGTTGLLWNYENGNTLFATNNIERLRIASNGGVGISTDKIPRNHFLHIAAPSQDYTNSSTQLTDGGGIMLQHTDTLASTGRTYPGIFWSGNTSALGRARAGIIGVSASNNDATHIAFLTRTAADGTSFYPSDERMRITSDGYLQQHKLIAVSYSDTRGISLSNQELTTSNFYNTTFFASDSTILDSNGHFVAPVHGIYRLFFRCTTDGVSGNRANVRLRKNGNTINEAYGSNNGSTNQMSVSSEIVMELNAGEYLDIQVGQLHTQAGSQHKQVTFHMLG